MAIDRLHKNECGHVFEFMNIHINFVLYQNNLSNILQKNSIIYCTKNNITKRL